MTDPFAKLIRPKTQFDEETKSRLANLLEPFVWLDPENKSIIYKEDSLDLNAMQKVLVFALARKAIALISNSNAATFSPNEVELQTQIPGGTVRPKLVELSKKKILNRTEDGYELASNFFISEIEKILRK
ncbi:MAG: hypothetical protein ABTQ25_17335 [Nitrosomonas ureae]